MRPDARPDVLADGRALPLRDGSVDACLLDPPYTERYSRDLYGTAFPRARPLLAEAARVVAPGGAIGILHFFVPNPPPGTALVRVWGVTLGCGFRIRAFSLYRREQARLPLTR